MTWYFKISFSIFASANDGLETAITNYPDVRMDMESIFNHLVKEREPYYQHTLEGNDDMPAHAKSSIIGTSVTIPITNGKLNLGTWQGIYLCEFRDYGGNRRMVATISGE